MMNHDPARPHIAPALFPVLIGLGLALAADATAQDAPPPPKVFHACYVPGSGTVYRIGEPGMADRCSGASHVMFSWTDGEGAVRIGDPAGGDLAGSYPDPSVAGLAGHPLADLEPEAGQVLGFDGEKWAPVSPASGGATAHGSLTGLDADDHVQYLLTDGVREATDGFAVTGGSIGGSIPVEGPGIRLLWHAPKGALRAGRVQGSQWNDGNIGEHSAAFGRNVIASGSGAFATGFASSATGGNAIALGSQATASGLGSFATGSLAQALGESSVGIGSASFADGENAVALGHAAQALGESSASVGSFARAEGNHSLALAGGRTSGVSSLAFGTGAHASGAGAIALGGEGVNASGARSVAIGRHASTNGMIGAFVYNNDPFSVVPVEAVAIGQFVVRAPHIWLGTNESVTAPAGQFLTTSTGAYLSSGGTWTNASDGARKTAFEEVDADAVLRAVAELPIRSWSYRDEDPSVRHIGPTAQDFHSAFGLGGDERAIATVDVDGVALLAIQALEARIRRLEARLAELEAERRD